jgi:hypothetical protein
MPRQPGKISRSNRLPASAALWLGKRHYNAASTTVIAGEWSSPKATSQRRLAAANSLRSVSTLAALRAGTPADSAEDCTHITNTMPAA